MSRLPPSDSPWLAVLPHESASALGEARLCQGIEAAATVAEIWLRGPALNGDIVRALRGVSGLVWREPLPDQRWRSPGDLLPGGSVPAEITAADWRPLSRTLVPDMPELAIAEPVPSLLPLRVVPGGEEEPPTILLLPIRELCAWAESAPEVRLRPLRFAVNAAGLALVYGSPLPPLPGQAWWESGGVAFPCGYHPEADLPPQILQTITGLPPGGTAGLVLLHPSGTAEHIPGEALVSLNRASARMSAALMESSGG